MKIALSTDHTGFELLQKLEHFLNEKGYECLSYGPERFNKDDDYPDFIKPAARAVGSGECRFGIIFGGSGQGEAMVANRTPGVRCAVYYGPSKPVQALDVEGRPATDEYEVLRLSRQHNDANMLSLASRFLTQEEVEKAVSIWLDATFSDIDRHARRLSKFDP